VLRSSVLAALLLVLACAALGACKAEGGAATREFVVYSGRAEPLVGPAIESFQRETGIRVRVRYGDTAALAALLLEERGRSPAAVFIAQDAGGLGAVESAGLLAALPSEVLQRVPASYRSPQGRWVGVSGRVRTLVYSTERVRPEELPGSVLALTEERWRGRVGWAPTNGSFQAFVTGLRLLHGDQKAEAWLRAMRANQPKDYPKNGAIVQAVGAGDIDVGLVNHYYLHRALDENPAFVAANHYAAAGDVGALMNVAGAGVLVRAQGSEREAAIALVRHLLAPEAQAYFAREAYEYPLAEGAQAPAGVPPLTTLRPPPIDLGALSDLEGTLALLRETGVLP
jgi:iron(III) transport system substrate-binding protein